MEKYQRNQNFVKSNDAPRYRIDRDQFKINNRPKVVGLSDPNETCSSVCEYVTRE